MNNDGYADLIVGARYNDAGGAYAGRAYVYSGQTGALFSTLSPERLQATSSAGRFPEQVM